MTDFISMSGNLNYIPGAEPEARNNEPTRLVASNKSEAERAAEWKERVADAMVPVMRLMDQAFDEGFEINSSVGKDFRGKHVVAVIRAIPKWA